MKTTKNLVIVCFIVIIALVVIAASPDTQLKRAYDFFFEAGRGAITNYSTVLKFGRNVDVDTGATEDIWDGGGIWVAPTTARLHTIVSGSASDTSAGTGARTVEIYGLGDTGLLQTETITMAGTSDVTTTLEYTMIHRMIVRAAGSGGGNVGIVSATAITDATVTAQIAISNNQTLMAIYQVPSDKKGCIVGYYADMNRSVTTGAANIFLVAKPDGEVFQIKQVNGIVGAGGSIFQRDFKLPSCFDPLTILKLQATTSANNTDVSAGFDIVLIGQ